MRRCFTPAASRLGVHERLRQLLMSMRPPSGAGNRMPLRLPGICSNAATVRAKRNRARRAGRLSEVLQPALRVSAPHAEHAALEVDVAPLAAERLLGPDTGPTQKLD